MKKEVILAIVIGFGIGLLITFGIYTARTSLKRNSSTDTTISSPAPTSSTSIPTSANLIITSPSPDALVDTDTVELSGKTTPEAIITIIGPAGQQIITADTDGDFSTTLELEGGINQIEIATFSTEGQKTETSLTVVYSTAKI